MCAVPSLVFRCSSDTKLFYSLHETFIGPLMFCLLCLGDIVEDSRDSLCSGVIEFPVPNLSQHLPLCTVREQLYQRPARDILSDCSFSECSDNDRSYVPATDSESCSFSECGDSDCDYSPAADSDSESAVDSCDDVTDSEKPSSNARCGDVMDLVQDGEFSACVWNTITGTDADNDDNDNVENKTQEPSITVTTTTDADNEDNDKVDNNIEAPSITVTTTNNSGRIRRYDKKTYCCFCAVPQSKLCRHLKLVHSDEEEIQKFLNAVNKEEKNHALLKLRNLGNHSHNQDVLEKGFGELIVVHRPAGKVDYRDYIPCRYCYGYFAKQSIWKHRCPLGPTSHVGTKVKRVRKAAAHLLPGSSTSESEISFAGLIGGLRKDAEGRVALRDTLILKLGRRLCSKFGGDSQQFNYIRSKLRLVARLLICLRRVSGQPTWCMSDFINPTQFKYVVEAAKECAGFSDSDSQYKAPSNALKSGAVLRTLAEI